MDQNEFNEKMANSQQETKSLQIGMSSDERIVFILQNTINILQQHYEDMKLIANQALAANNILLGGHSESDPTPIPQESEIDNDPAMEGGVVG